MPRLLSVISQKGGVGKTTVALNLAYALACRGHRTLLVDVDPSGGIGLSLAGKPSAARGVFEWMRNGGEVEDYFIKTRQDTLALLPVGHPPRGPLTSWITQMNSPLPLQMIAEAASAFDLIVVDTPAGLSGPTWGALLASTHALIPVASQPMSLRTLPRAMEAIGEARALGSPVELAGVVLTMSRFQSATRAAVASELWSSLPGDVVLDAHVPLDETFTDASAAGVPVSLLRRRPPPAAAAFDLIAIEVEWNLGLSYDEEEDAPIYLVG